MASDIEPGAPIAASHGRRPAAGAGRAATRSIAVALLCLACSALPAAASGAAQDRALARAIQRIAHPLTGEAADYDRLIQRIGDARIVMLGEDTHGTHEFYLERARITQRLISEQGFGGVVIEADWSEVAGLRDFLTGRSHPADAAAALGTFDRFPRWMWRNTDFRDFAAWLRQFNLRRDAGAPGVGIHGMDLYAIVPAAVAVIGYLEGVNPIAAAKARERYMCLDSGDDRLQGTGAAPRRWPDIDCGRAVQDQLTELTTGAFLPGQGSASIADREYLHALQSARVVRNAEAYFRAMQSSEDTAWNLRDTHMASSVDLLLAHLDAVTGARSRLVIWAHNAHVGDARATARGEAGGVTIGQLVRERHLDDAVLVGFTTATGIVRAATDWGGPDMRKRLRQPIPGSHAALMHATGLRKFCMIIDDAQPFRAALDRPRPQRGVGVRYLPGLELAGHYYMARLAGQFDAVVHIDRTTPLQSLPGR